MSNLESTKNMTSIVVVWPGNCKSCLQKHLISELWCHNEIIQNTLLDRWACRWSLMHHPKQLVFLVVLTANKTSSFDGRSPTKTTASPFGMAYRKVQAKGLWKEVSQFHIATCNNIVSFGQSWIYATMIDAYWTPITWFQSDGWIKYERGPTSQTICRRTFFWLNNHSESFDHHPIQDVLVWTLDHIKNSVLRMIRVQKTCTKLHPKFLAEIATGVALALLSAGSWLSWWPAENGWSTHWPWRYYQDTTIIYHNTP